MPPPRQNDQSTWTARERQDLRDRGYRARRVGEFPPVGELIRPDDYVSDTERGTVEFSREWRNYAFHKIVVPDGAVIENCNFAQRVPDTEVFTANAPFTVRNCNLVNVRIHPLMQHIGCLVASVEPE